MDSVQDGRCLISWRNVCRPRAYDGLGIFDLRTAGCALRLCWLWLQRSDHTYWANLKAPIEWSVSNMFACIHLFLARWQHVNSFLDGPVDWGPFCGLLSNKPSPRSAAASLGITLDSFYPRWQLLVDRHPRRPHYPCHLLVLGCVGCDASCPALSGSTN